MANKYRIVSFKNTNPIPELNAGHFSLVYRSYFMNWIPDTFVSYFDGVFGVYPVYKVEPNLILISLGILVKLRWVELGDTGCFSIYYLQPGFDKRKKTWCSNLELTWEETRRVKSKWDKSYNKSCMLTR